MILCYGTADFCVVRVRPYIANVAREENGGYGRVFWMMRWSYGRIIPLFTLSKTGVARR